MDKTDRVAASIISKSDRLHPADSVLRAELKAAKGLSREEGRAISRLVFACYRWRGWVETGQKISEQLKVVREFDKRFRENPRSFDKNELQRAVPEWIWEHLSAPMDWLREIQEEPALWLRAKAGQGSAVAEALGDCRLAAPGALSDTLWYGGGKDLFRTKEFHAGKFELQDISSQIVGILCAPQPGETWWDACAGEGGKTLHLSDLMQNKGLIWASDRAEWRLKKLKQRTARAGVFNYRAALWDGGTRLPTKARFDGILVDAPCSGVGTWQRNPHARWTLTPEDVRELAMVQERLLENVIPALKPGGRLIYSVCTLTAAETTGVLEKISRKFPNLKAARLANPLAAESATDEGLWLWPQTVNGNGMFVCAWENGGV